MKIKKNTIKNLYKKSIKNKKKILHIAYKVQKGHIGSALSVSDIITVLYNAILNINPKKPKDPSRDRFILSKGHSALALYVALNDLGFIPNKKLLKYCCDGGELSVHPDYNLDFGIEFSTGSLGHGLSIGIGLALGLKNNAHNFKKIPRVFVLMSDGEMNEGSVWEGIMFSAHHKIDNLVVIVDDNGLQAFGKTEEIINIQPLIQKWEVFGWAVEELDGHNLIKTLEALKRVPFVPGKPSVIIAKTCMGKGISFMENKFEWHYLQLDDKLYKKAIKEIIKTQ